MEFGKLGDIENVNWKMPQRDPLVEPFLRSHQTHVAPQIHIGAPAWGRKEWIGRLYPTKTPATDFLYHYSRYFNCIELNTTHYRIPSSEMIQNWLRQVPLPFLFCPKFPQTISHGSNGLRDRETLRQWQDALCAFGRNLGPSFLQFSPHFSYRDKIELFAFLKSWPDELPLALEFRHPSWFQNGRILPALVEYLQKRQIGLVITDVAGRRDVLHLSVSSTFSILRFIGNDLHPSDYARSQNWVKQISQWTRAGLQQFFFMVHEPDDIKTPEMANFVASTLNRICNTAHPPFIASL